MGWINWGDMPLSFGSSHGLPTSALSARVLTLLQFTRAALVFTALADTMCALLLRASKSTPPGEAVWRHLDPISTMLALSASGCLYAFGMALNDLVDRRRDAVVAATRPLPSGRLGVYTAHLIVTVLALAALALGGMYAMRIGSPGSFAMLVLTLLLINFYNFAGKYLVSAGLVTLGLVRMTHAMVAAPEVPVVWHPLWLFTHVLLVSAVAYVWEEKRPRITPLHSMVISLSLGVVNVVGVGVVMGRRWEPGAGLQALANNLSFRPGLLFAVSATAVFYMLARRIGMGVFHPREEVGAESGLRTRRRRGGQKLMLAGLLWLIVLDGAFVVGYVGWVEGLMVLMMLPLAYGAVRLMRAWSSLVSLARPPEFQRVRSLWG